MPGHLTGRCCNGATAQTVPAEWLLLAHQRQQAHISRSLLYSLSARPPPAGGDCIMPGFDYWLLPIYMKIWDSARWGGWCKWMSRSLEGKKKKGENDHLAGKPESGSLYFFVGFAACCSAHSNYWRYLSDLIGFPVKPISQHDVMMTPSSSYNTKSFRVHRSTSLIMLMIIHTDFLHPIGRLFLYSQLSVWDPGPSYRLVCQ